MDGNEILLLGLGIQLPWQLVDQRLDVDKQPHELHRVLPPPSFVIISIPQPISQIEVGVG